MKKYYIMAVAGLLALSSCSKDSDVMEINEGPHPMTFMANYGDGADTRATLGSDYKVSWVADDAISILSAKNANALFKASTAGLSSAFTGTATDDTKFYAIYPFTSGLTLDGTTIKGVVIPTEQVSPEWKSSATEATSGWDPKAPVALAVADAGQNLKFTNLCAILKATIKTSAVYYSVKVSAQENLAGTFDLNTETGALSATAGSTSISTGVGSNIISSVDRVIYLAIAPGTYSTFECAISIVAGSTSLANSWKKETITFEKGKIYDLGTFVLEGGRVRKY